MKKIFDFILRLKEQRMILILCVYGILGMLTGYYSVKNEFINIILLAIMCFSLLVFPKILVKYILKGKDKNEN